MVNMESVVYRWPPSTARSVLSTVGLSPKISTVPVERFAALRGHKLEYYHYEESFRNEEAPDRVSLPTKTNTCTNIPTPCTSLLCRATRVFFFFFFLLTFFVVVSRSFVANKVWKLDQSCKVTEVFPYNYGKKDGWNPMAEKTHSMCWCFTVSWSKKQADNTHVLQIGFEREVDAIAWHDTIKGMVDRLVEAGGLNSSMLKKVNREYTPQGTPRLEQDGDEEVGTWYAIKHINGGEPLALFLLLPFGGGADQVLS